jgi:hypothetical protein
MGTVPAGTLGVTTLCQEGNPNPPERVPPPPTCFCFFSFSFLAHFFLLPGAFAHSPPFWCHRLEVSGISCLRRLRRRGWVHS